MIPISFDPKKDKINIRKHGISLARAKDFDMDGAYVTVEDSQDYGEVRYCGIGWLSGNLYVVTFTAGSDHFRVINLRAAEPSERKEYAEND